LKKSKVKHSFSALDTFSNICERQFYYKSVLKEPEPPSEYLIIGGYYHEVIANALTGGQAGADYLLQKIKKEQGWIDTIDEKALVAEVQANLRRLEAEVFPHLKVTEVEKWSPWEGPYCAKLDVYSATTPIVDAKGAITGVKDEPCVIDWKTSFGKRRKQKDVESSLQLVLYCLVKECRSAAFIEIPRKTSLPIVTLPVTFDDYWLNRYKTYMDVQFAAMDSRGTCEEAYKLAPQGHPLCKPQYCRYWRRCPGGEGGS
jgi:hypothetical protein